MDGSGSQLLELKEVTFHSTPVAISPADRMNGLEAAAKAWIQATVLRRTREVTSDSWDPWQDGGQVFWLGLEKRKGLDWSVQPTKGGTTYESNWYSGYLQKYPCDNVPGHPARLAREQAERDRAQRAAEAVAAEEDARRRVERARVEREIAGEWVNKQWGPYSGTRLTITRDGDRFSAVEVWPGGNSRRFLDMVFLPDNMIKLTSLRTELIDRSRNGEAPMTPDFIVLSADAQSLMSPRGTVLYGRP